MNTLGVVLTPWFLQCTGRIAHSESNDTYSVGDKENKVSFKSDKHFRGHIQKFKCFCGQKNNKMDLKKDKQRTKRH